MSARTDLCGGRSAMIVPTATLPNSADTRLSSFLGSGRITGKPHLTACCSDRSHHAASDSCTAETRDRQASLSSKLWFSKGLSGFPDDFPGLFVVSKRNELRVTKMVCVCPFQKVHAGYGLWSKPQCRMPDYAACIVGRRFRRLFDGDLHRVVQIFFAA